MQNGHLAYRREMGIHLITFTICITSLRRLTRTEINTNDHKCVAMDSYTLQREIMPLSPCQYWLHCIIRLVRSEYRTKSNAKLFCSLNQQEGVLVTLLPTGRSAAQIVRTSKQTELRDDIHHL